MGSLLGLGLEEVGRGEPCPALGLERDEGVCCCLRLLEGLFESVEIVTWVLWVSCKRLCASGWRIGGVD